MTPPRLRNPCRRRKVGRTSPWRQAHGDRERGVGSTGEAYATGDVAAMMRFVDSDLEWTYLDPAFEDPDPRVCHGTQELRIALQRQARRGLKSRLEEVHANGNRVMVAVHTPGLDALRARQADDRNYDVLTIRDGRIVAMRACRDRQEALSIAGVSDS
jgi:ketosteroid isomerase-like protein